jgi:hypothetical protein
MPAHNIAPAADSPLPFPRLYRAHVTAADTYGVERTAFVEAASHRAAARKIANVVAAMENRLPEHVEERIYNVLIPLIVNAVSTPS